MGLITTSLLLAAGCGSGDEPTPEVGDAAGAGVVHFHVHEPEGDRVRGNLLLIHGGAWRDSGPSYLHGAYSRIATFLDLGWRVVAIGHRQPRGIEEGSFRDDGRRAMDDVVAFHDQVRRAWPDLPVCAWGSSSGGHLAAMLAVERPELDCALLEGAPLDLVEMRDTVQGHDLSAPPGPDNPPVPGQTCATEPAGGVERRMIMTRWQSANCLAALAFGREEAGLERWSPAHRWQEAEPSATVIAAQADGDHYVGNAQARSFERQTGVEVRILPSHASDPPPPGPYEEDFAHIGVAEEAWRELLADWSEVLEAHPPREVEMPGPDPDGRHRACDAALPEGPGWRRGERPDRHLLLAAATGVWRQERSRDGLLHATFGCEGSSRRQEAGMALWPRVRNNAQPPNRVPEGSSAALVYVAPSGRSARSLEAAFRGFRSPAGDWTVGLYAGRDPDARPDDAVVECRAGRRCAGVAEHRSAIGRHLAPDGFEGDPDERSTMPSQAFGLPDGTRRIEWRIVCENPDGCDATSLNGGREDAQLEQPGRVRDGRDQDGRRVVLTVYDPVVLLDG